MITEKEYQKKLELLILNDLKGCKEGSAIADKANKELEKLYKGKDNKWIIRRVINNAEFDLFMMGTFLDIQERNIINASFDDLKNIELKLHNDEVL